MGLFLAMSGIANVTEADVLNALRDYAISHGGSLTECPATEESWEFLIISESQPGKITVAYPGEFMDWDDAAAHLSQSLNVSVFSFHIHDDDLWMYTLFNQGEEVDQFNPIPDYWGEISDEERQTWAGSVSAILNHWPDLRAEDVERYLAFWDLDDDSPGKAYSTDEFEYGNSWQLVDFMRRLGLDYPVDDRGQAHGRTFQFVVEGM